MNTKTILNIAAFSLAVAGIALRAAYMPGGHIALLLSGASMLLTLFLFGVQDNRAAGMSTGINYFLTGTMAFWITGTIFKLHHWPGAGLFVLPGCLLAVILPLILCLRQADFKISRQFFLVFCILFMLIVSVFIRNNPAVQLIGKGWDFPIDSEAAPDSTGTNNGSK